MANQSKRMRLISVVVASFLLLATVFSVVGLPMKSAATNIADSIVKLTD